MRSTAQDLRATPPPSQHLQTSARHHVQTCRRDPCNHTRMVTKDEVDHQLTTKRLQMQTPLQITFRDFPPSPSLEERTREWVAELETFFDGIVSCRVSIEAPHRHHHQGRLYRVRVELGVPGERIVVGRSPDEHAAHADPYVALRDTFRATRRRLEDYVRRRLRHEVKSHALPSHGRIVHLEPDFKYGRLVTEDDREIYFHRNSVIGGIEHLTLGAEVRFHEEEGDEGPQATTVEPIGAHGHHAVSP